MANEYHIAHVIYPLNIPHYPNLFCIHQLTIHKQQRHIMIYYQISLNTVKKVKLCIVGHCHNDAKFLKKIFTEMDVNVLEKYLRLLKHYAPFQFCEFLCGRYWLQYDS
jgi:hypothetical protein